MGKRLTPIKAIRAKCLDCSAGSHKEIRECPIDRCSLYPYRMGKNPYIKRRKGSNVAGMEALRKYREDQRKKEVSASV